MEFQIIKINSSIPERDPHRSIGSVKQQIRFHQKDSSQIDF